MIKPILSYNVAPSIPKELECLNTIAYNLFWVWDHDMIELFRRIDSDLWERTNHNPVQLLGMINQERLNTLVHDDAFLMQVERAYQRLLNYQDKSSSWFNKNYASAKDACFAYFSAEFGLTECLQNYSGGLGLLSGDHLKAASDLGVPIVGVGLLYQQGYFRQYLNADGWQQERNPENDFYILPIKQAIDNNKPKTISIELPGRIVTAQIWLVQVGRITLVLLDTNIPQNSPEDQDITDQLYGGDREMRIKQEILLGIGGFRALKELGFNPKVYHLNEGHSAFSTLEHTKYLIQKHNVSFAEAKEVTIASTVFTTHTPVPAGNDYFDNQLIEKYFSKYYRDLGLSSAEFFGLGREVPNNESESFCMTILALKMSGHSNAVSKLHGNVSRHMWKNVWPGVPVNEIPIISITNGVHARTWISSDMAGLFDRYLGPNWSESTEKNGIWKRVDQIPDEELWRTHERRRERLVAFARNRLKMQLENRGATPHDVAKANEILNPEALTIAFSRRFATYKRSTLLLRNPERLLKLLSNKERPIQFIFAGKAHPHDNPGKELIRQIIHFERQPEARRRMVFIEDYDIVVARYLVQGADVWLNTPRRPMEASGTSGMKATFNGAINVSILDGWWDEAYNTNTGWAIGRGEEYKDEDYQNEVESNALFDLLEKEIIPLYYSRTSDDLPRAWIAKMKTAIAAICSEYNTNRMVRQYTEEMYLPALNKTNIMLQNNLEHAKELAAWKQYMHINWKNLKILNVDFKKQDGLKVGEESEIHAIIDLGKLKPSDVSVEVFYGPINARGEIEYPNTLQLEYKGSQANNTHEFIGTIKLLTSGRMGHTLRILPKHPNLISPFREGMILWAQ